MTEVEQPPQNGIDLSAAEDDDSSKARPADIEQDMREMERRKRVEAIMGSKLFREELERIVDSAREGGASGILQQLSDIVGVPVSRVGSVFKTSNCMVPINDIRGVESMGYAKGEKILRCKLAATFRLLDLYGWTQGLGAQITARLKVDQEYFLVNPYGLLYHEITASSLNKVDMQGNIIEQGTTNFGVNKSHFVLHSVVHAARPDIRCAIYIGCSPVVAISSLKTGLLPLTKDACVLGEITNYALTGTFDEEERDKLVRNLGPNSKVMLLSNHGALCCGETIEEAFYAACHIVQACETQLKLLPVGIDNLVLIPEESRKIIYEKSRRPPEDLEKKFAAVVSIADENKEEGGASAAAAVAAAKSAPKWRVGGAEFEALMRMLDNAGYRTGYIYRHPLIKSDPPKPKNDVELPPAVSSLGYLLEEEELFRQGIWKKGDIRKGGDRSRWLNSPNVYQKVEVLETGTPDPKKITKWVAEGSPTHSTPVRIEDPLQFVPTGTSTKEFKRLQQQIKDNRRADKISAGPQSHILEGVTWDEANRIKDATVSQAGDHVVLMGAASKGIIQRGFQHNATVYKAPYAKNPFDNVTDDELNEYKRTVERKKKSIHGEYTDTDFSESEALSSLQTSGAQQTKQTTTTTTAAVSQSEPETSEHQVLRIETQQAPVPSQAEVVLSDATLSFINGERSHTATNRKPPTGRDYENSQDTKKKKQKYNNRGGGGGSKTSIDNDDENDSNKENSYESTEPTIIVTSATVPAIDDGSQVRVTPNCRRELLLELQSDGVCNQAIIELNQDTDDVIDLEKQAEFLNSGKDDNTNGQSQADNLCNYFPISRQQLIGSNILPTSETSYAAVAYATSAYEYDYVNSGTNSSANSVVSERNCWYDTAQTKQLRLKKSSICCTPKICVGIWRVLGKPKKPENRVMCRTSGYISQQQISHYKYGSTPTTTSTTANSTANSSPRQPLGHSKVARSNPYRTLSHFGFNSPRQLPRLDHKHLPIIKEAKNYKPVRRSISYEEIFSTPRYDELCENCFEKLLRLKPELLLHSQHRNQMQTQLQNQFLHSPRSSCNDGIASTEYQYVEINDYEKCENPNTLMEIEVEEATPALPPKRSSSTQTLDEPNSVAGFIKKINKFNFDDESDNINFVGGLRSISSDFTIDDIEVPKLKPTRPAPPPPPQSTTVESGSNVPTSVLTGVTEIWNFGDWQECALDNLLQPGHQPLTDRRIIFEITQRFDKDSSNEKEQDVKDSISEVHIDTNVSTASKPNSFTNLMQREERQRRKTEFQELWEDHINFFRAVEGRFDPGNSSFETENMDTKISILPRNNVHNETSTDDEREFNNLVPLLEDLQTISESTNIEKDRKLVKQKDVEIQTEFTTNEDGGSQQAILTLIQQFEQSLYIAGDNLNNLMGIVTRQYKSLQDKSSLDEALALQRQPMSPKSSLTMIPRCTLTEIFTEIEQNDFNLKQTNALPIINEDPMEEDDEERASVASSNKTFNMEMEEVEIHNEDDDTMPIDPITSEIMEQKELLDSAEIKQISHYVTLENITSTADEIPSKYEDPRTDSLSEENCDNFNSLYISSENKVENSNKLNSKHQDLVIEPDTEPTEEKTDVAVEQEEESDEKYTNFSTLERKILKKIEENQLKESEEIFGKIDQTIRNKFTPSKLKKLVEQQIASLGQQKSDDQKILKSGTAFTSTPTNNAAHTMDSVKFFNFGNSFNEHQVDYYTSETETTPVFDVESELIQSDPNLPTCSKYVKQKAAAKSHMRLSKSLTPTDNQKNSNTSIKAVFQTGSRTSLRRRLSGKFHRQHAKAIPSQTQSAKRRNFILENIRNAGKPRSTSTSLTPRKNQAVEKKSAKPKYPTSYKKKTQLTAGNELANECVETSVFSFQTTGTRGSQRFWLSMPTKSPGSTTSNEEDGKKSTNGKRKRVECEHKKVSSPKFESSNNSKPELTLQTQISSTTFFLPSNDENSRDQRIDAGNAAQSISTTTFDMYPINNEEEDLHSKSSCYSLSNCPSMMHLHSNSTHMSVTPERHNNSNDTQETSYYSADASSEREEHGCCYLNADEVAQAKNKGQQSVEPALPLSSSGYSLEHSMGTTNLTQSSSSNSEDMQIQSEVSESNENTDDFVVIDTHCSMQNFVLYVTDSQEDTASEEISISDSSKLEIDAIESIEKVEVQLEEEEPQIEDGTSSYSSRLESGLSELEENQTVLLCVDRTLLPDEIFEQIDEDEEEEGESPVSDNGHFIQETDTVDERDEQEREYIIDKVDKAVQESSNMTSESDIGMQPESGTCSESQNENPNYVDDEPTTQPTWTTNNFEDKNISFSENDNIDTDEYNIKLSDETNLARGPLETSAASESLIDFSYNENYKGQQGNRTGYDGDDEHEIDGNENEFVTSTYITVDKSGTALFTDDTSTESDQPQPSVKNSDKSNNFGIDQARMKIVVDLRGAQSSSSVVSGLVRIQTVPVSTEPTTSGSGGDCYTGDCVSGGERVDGVDEITSSVVDNAIESLGEQIDEITPRLRNYKRKIDDFGAHVAKCARHMDECILEQEDIAQQQQQLHENIALNQYAEETVAQVETYSLSETED